VALTHWLLFLHLLGAFAFVAGAAVAGTLQVAALRRDRPSEVLILLRLTRVGVLLVLVGATFTLAFGIALASHVGFGLSPAWIQTSLALWAASVVTGAIGGRTARHARYLAERLAAEGDRPSEELRALVGHRPSLWLSYLSGALVLAIVVLMVWKPS
jgi:uncharacterized membrane protein